MTARNLLKRDLRPVEEQSEEQSCTSTINKMSLKNMLKESIANTKSIKKSLSSSDNESWHLSQDRGSPIEKDEGIDSPDYCRSFTTVGAAPAKKQAEVLLMSDVVLNIDTLREGRISDYMKIFTLREA